MTPQPLPATSVAQPSPAVALEASHHVLTTALEAMAELVVILGHSCAAVFDTVLSALMDASLYPHPAPRVAAARCLRSLVEVVPTRAGATASQVITRVKDMRANPVALDGAVVSSN